MNKIITWVDLQGRYRVTSPAYNDPKHANKSESDLLALVWDKCKAHYKLPDNHPFFTVEDATQRNRLEECCGNYFRYDASGSASNGAWEMDVNGTPKVNMSKARGAHMSRIRVARDVELAKLDLPYMRALEGKDTAEQARIVGLKQKLRNIPQTFKLEGYATPKTLKAAWPSELDRRN